MTDDTARLERILARYSRGLTPADLPPGTAGDLLHYRTQPGARGRAIQTLLRAVEAAKRSGGLGLVSDCTAAPAYVGVCRHGRWARVLQIDAIPPGLALEAELVRLSLAG